MRVNTAALALLSVCLQGATAAPATQSGSLLRLIKTSEEDAGQWIREDELFDRFTSKNIGFIDITDIQDEDVLRILSTKDEELVARRAVEYPKGALHKDKGNAMVNKVDINNPKSWLKTYSDYNTRHYRSKTGTEAATWLFEKVKTLASKNSAITVSQFKHSFNQPSVIARIPGEKPDLVIIGAHLDSTGGSVEGRSPGADDNGSGTVTILENFRVLSENGFKPKNTLEFHWYAGEEGGLLGSKDIFANYKNNKKSVIAMLNVDMTGYSPSGKIAVYTDNVDPALTSYVRAIASEYTGPTITSSCGYGCSDHASARANGFPAAFINEDEFKKSNPNIHTARDTYDKIQWDSVLRHTKFTTAFAVEASLI